MEEANLLIGETIEEQERAETSELILGLLTPESMPFPHPGLIQSVLWTVLLLQILTEMYMEKKT